MYLLITVGTNIGAINTIILVIISGILGFSLLRSRGLKAIYSISSKLNKQEFPVENLFGGLFLTLGGLLLIIPGFFTDLLGILCLIPQLRKFLLSSFIAMLSPFELKARRENKNSNNDWIEGEFDKEK
tara:strand:+ start:8344 stop:8727 length:384 start_codon:yes stop_codon:yes gene_type:complete